MQHTTGLYKRLKYVMTDEDVEKWRAERKRRHPCSNENKNLIEAEKIEKEKRGEVITISNKKFSTSGKPEKLPKNRKRRRNRPFKEPIFEEIDFTKQEIYRGIRSFRGTGILDELETLQWNDSAFIESSTQESKQCKLKNLDQMPEMTNFKVSDDEEELALKMESLNPLTKSTDAPLSNLVADYGSSSDSDDPPEELPIKRVKIDEVQNSSNDDLQSQIKSRVSTDFISSEKASEKFGEIEIPIKTEKICTSVKERVPELENKKTNLKNFENPNKPHKNKNNNKISSSSHSNNNNNNNNSKQKASATSIRLLNKLLERSIQHERNTIFQCITYIANENFFD